jgi:hypothetical protein
MSRWFSFYDSNAENRQLRHSKAFVILVMLFVEKQVSPNFLLALSLQLAPEQFKKLPAPEQAEGDGNAEEKKETEKQSEMSQKRKERQMYSNCQAAVLALTREKNILAMDLIYWFVRPFRAAHTDLVTTLHKGPAAVKDWYKRAALGSHYTTLSEVLANKKNQQALLELGFVLEVGHSIHEDILPEDPLALEQDWLAEQVDALVLHLLSEHSREAATHLFSPLAAAAGLLSESSADRSVVLIALQKTYAAWQETSKRPKPSLQNILARSPLSCVLEQEMLHHMATENFRSTPACVVEMLDHVFGSLGSSLVCELGFQQWEGHERRGICRTYTFLE